MDLLNSKQLSKTLTDLQQFQSECEEKKRQSAANDNLLLGRKRIPNRPDDPNLERIITTLKEAEDLCKAAKWDAAHSTIALNNVHLTYNKSESDWSSLAVELRTALHCLMSAMWRYKFVQVSPAYSNYVNHDALLGTAVKDAFRSAADDIREAGNCIAIDSGTAAVFYLMRAVEWGVRALSVNLGVLDVPRKSATIPIEFAEWDKILDQLYPAVEKKVDSLGPGQLKQETQEFYFPLLFDIKGFKDAFRNHVMHTRQTYSQKAADDVLDYVRRFLVLLSTKISE